MGPPPQRHQHVQVTQEARLCPNLLAQGICHRLGVVAVGMWQRGEKLCW